VCDACVVLYVTWAMAVVACLMQAPMRAEAYLSAHGHAAQQRDEEQVRWRVRIGRERST